MKTNFLFFFSRYKAVFLAICLCSVSPGGGGSLNHGLVQIFSPDMGNPPGPGYFEAATFIKTIHLADVLAALPKEVARAITPRYSVDTYKLIYTTTDANGLSVRASGLVAIPRKASTLASPVLSYQHPTVKTDAEAPSNHSTPDEPAILFASMGYLVSAADYVGYGASKGLPHPYLLAAPTAASVSDFITASARWRQIKTIPSNGQLFLTGYSEGAYASMAALRHMTQNKLPLSRLPAAAFVGAGPYDVALTLDVFLDALRKKNPVLAALVDPEILKTLGTVYRAGIRSLLLFSALGSKSDVSFDGTFLDNFLNNDMAAIDATSNVYDWTPQSPIIFFHGRDDSTVPHSNTAAALHAMSRRGAGTLVEGIDCHAQPAEHISCVASFLISDITRLGALAQGL